VICTLASKEILLNYKDYYDEKEHLICDLVNSLNNILFQFKNVHDIHQSIEYALYLLENDAENNKDTICDIIRAVLKYQCTDNGSSKNGCWDYFQEADVVKGYDKIYKTDVMRQNGRMAVTLVQILKHYSDFLPSELCEKVRKSLLSTIYTFRVSYKEMLNLNGVLTFVYPAYLFACMYKNNGIKEFGRKMLDEVYYSALNNDSFYEYNDMNAFRYNSELLSAIMRDVDDKYCLKCCRYIYDMLWRDMSENFHKNTMQLAGPFMSGDDMYGNGMHCFLNDALRGKLFGVDKLMGYLSRCPAKYVHNFTKNKGSVFSQKVITNGMVYPHFRHSIVATTYIQDKYCFGSFNCEKFWDYRKLFIGYFGSAENLYSFKIDVLHDGYQYASAVNHCVQYNGSAVGHVTFITDGGDRHIDIDAPNPFIYAKDFRIRFEINGDIDNLSVSETENGIIITHEDIKLYYRIPYFKFDKTDVRLECTKTSNKLYYDVVLYEGREKIIDFAGMKSAILEYNFLITGTDRKLGDSYRTDSENGRLLSKLVTDRCILSLSTPVRPGREINCLTDDEQFINGVRIERQIEYVNKIMDNYKFVATQFDSENSDVEKSILDIAEHIKHNSFSENCECISDIMNILLAKKYDDDVKRKIIILVLHNLFEVSKSYNFTYEELINKRFSNIYQGRVFIDKPNAVMRDILKIANQLKLISSSPEEKKSSRGLIEECKKLIGENLLNPELSINFIAEKLDCSVGYLSGAFKKQMNMKYVDYIQQEKISYAIEKLQAGKITIKEVSGMLCYSSPNNFMRMFKKIKGKTVSEFLEYIKRD